MVVDQVFPKTQAKDGIVPDLVKASGEHMATLGKLTRIFEVTMYVITAEISRHTNRNVGS